jgi:prepilin-type processing-associated H-X9-DG protein
VIAIIAILAAILFPVFAQAKAAAKKTAAISNAKQIVLSEIMYANDYDDTVTPYFSGYNPSGIPSTYSGNQQYWPALLSTYVEKAQGGNAGGQPLSQNLSKVFFDPIENFTPQATTAVGNVASWGISDDFVQWWAPRHVTGSYKGANFSQDVNPAQAIIFAETFDFFDGTDTGMALALSVFDNNNYTYTNTAGGAPNQIVPHSGYSNPAGVVGQAFCANCWNGAEWTLKATYNGSYKRTVWTGWSARNGSAQQLEDMSGTNNVAFGDGHVKSMHLGAIAQGPGSAQYWSISGTNQWP